MSDFEIEDEVTVENDFSFWLDQQREEDWNSSAYSTSRAVKRKPSVIQARNQPIIPPLQSLESHTHNGIRLAPSAYVELQNGDFMRIIHIVQDTNTTEVTLRGWIFRRTREMNGLCDMKLNEVCWIIHIDEDDPRDAEIQGLETVAAVDVVRRRLIRLTNQAFPALSFRDDPTKDVKKTVEDERTLVCRFKYVCLYPNAKARENYSWCEKAFLRLREKECDKRGDNDLKDERLRELWRGTTVKGGARQDWLSGEKEYLRQESRSHGGKPSHGSLKMPFGCGPGRPLENVMEHGSVGVLLKEQDITANEPDNIDRRNIASLLRTRNNSVECTTSDARLLESTPRQRAPQESGNPYSSFHGLSFHGNESSSDEDVFELGKSLRESSIQPPRTRSPRITQIDAHITTTSRTGVHTKRFEGKITKSFTPTNMTQKKRSAQQSFGADDISSKRSRITKSTPRRCSPVSSESDSTIGGYRSDESIEEMLPPTAMRMYKESGRLASSSQNITTNRLFDNSGRLDSNQKPRSASMGRSSTIDYLHGLDRSPVVDLTAPLSGPQSISSQPRAAAGFCPDFSTERKVSLSSQVSSQRRLLLSKPNLNRDTKSGCRQSLSFQRPRGAFTRTRVLSREACRSSQGTSAHRVSSSSTQHQRYTFGDCFCGAGGMSRGAVQAGLRVDWGFDFNLAACQTYALNFFGTPIYNIWADQFAQARGDHKVDICHLSPPCQFFSDAHTIQGKDDDMNTASLFAIFNLLEKAKPRVVTLEQTSGLIRRHPIFFNAVVNMFTSRGFSVRWRVMNCADFGLPQRRMRLFIIASCPGEPLPPFPKPIHSASPTDTGLKLWTTINQTLEKIPPIWPNHDISSASQRHDPPRSGDQIATCITTSGGGIVHPSGERAYTHREFACLQSFPLGHKFGKIGVKRQIGNAVPPLIAEILLREVKKTLMETDGLL